MSVPFFKTKKEAEDFWGDVYEKGDPDGEIMPIWMFKTDGFLQAGEDGVYYVPRKIRRDINRNRVDEQIVPPPDELYLFFDDFGNWIYWVNPVRTEEEAVEVLEELNGKDGVLELIEEYKPASYKKYILKAVEE